MKLRHAFTVSVVGLVAAGGIAAPTFAAGGTTLNNPADKVKLAYVKTTLTAKPGKITLVMPNPSVLPHNIAIQGKGFDIKGPVVGKGKTSTVSATLKAGTYTFYCSVPGHEAAGMKGTLTVK